MVCGIIIKTIECDCKDNTTSLNSSQQQVDMYNGEKEISDVVVESQAANPKSGPSSMMGMHDSLSLQHHHYCRMPLSPRISQIPMLNWYRTGLSFLLGYPASTFDKIYLACFVFHLQTTSSLTYAVSRTVRENLLQVPFWSSGLYQIVP